MDTVERRELENRVIRNVAESRLARASHRSALSLSRRGYFDALREMVKLLENRGDTRKVAYLIEKTGMAPEEIMELSALWLGERWVFRYLMPVEEGWVEV